MPLLRDQAYKDSLNQFSSFMSVEKTLAEIVRRLMNNERLKRLLYYTDKHALGLPKLTQEQSYSLLNESILIVPKLKVDPDVKPYIIISLDSFTPMEGQTTFRSINVSFDVLCHYDHWALDDFKLRPYAIAGEIDSVINNSFVNTGLADFLGAKQLVLNEYLGGVSMFYTLETFFDDIQPQKPDMEKLHAR